MGNIINAIAILIGGTIGTIFGKFIPKRIEETVIQGLGLAVIVIGIQGMIQINNLLHLIFAMALGAIVGEVLDVDGLFAKGAKWVEKKVNKFIKGDIASGMIYASLIYCIGAMAVVGAIQMAQGDNSILVAKAAIDGITAIAFASVLGIGVAISGVVVFVYQGVIYLVALLLNNIFTGQYHDVMEEALKGVGGVLILGIGLNIINVAKIKVANLLPSLVFIIILTLLGGI